MLDDLMLLQEQEVDVLELLSKDFGDGRYKDVQNPVAKTWLISFYQVQKQDPLAAEYLSPDALGLLSAFFSSINPSVLVIRNNPTNPM
ncbi:hypothetical protein BJX63DRAFT_436798 [Aspergillus granulosus]|uniref:Uncharacterized protein n=1 Tax=Aspergillus granulosus TaxID=176169 RepID=A0ABR4GWV2_9EURO